MEFNSRKLDDILETVDAFKTTVKEIRKKNIELSNQNKNLEYRISALEQRLQEQEQQQLIKTIDIFNIPFTDNEDLLNVVQKIQQKLELEENIIEVKRFGYNRNNSGKLRVVLPSETVKTKWLTKAKDTKVMVNDILPSASPLTGKETIYISEALTIYIKTLLGNARRELKNSGVYKYVWCKNIVIRARKSEKDQSFIIRTDDDIKALLQKEVHVQPQ
ncbi:unnamed protein product [Parnassius apollo]|uniref:(apollo) hypothetical protein n=1 Tax=Parnassius apollo TaxID=110799 RepID=A0A8S3X7Q9_PARAO|nr:unnamed protein product [Parnassius apollo]